MDENRYSPMFRECSLQYRQHCESLADCATFLGLANTTGFDCTCNSGNPSNCEVSVRPSFLLTTVC